MPSRVGSGRVSGFWSAVPHGWAGTLKGAKTFCHFPMEPLAGRVYEDPAVEKCKWSVSGGLQALAAHVELVHKAAHPDVVAKSVSAYKGIVKVNRSLVNRRK